MALVDISCEENFQIVFEGIRGVDYKGDVAIDDVAMLIGPCPETS